MNLTPQTDALFYPFHLCHARTVEQLLTQFTRLHFRDYMALQLSPFFGTTAYPDRMGDFFPDLVVSGRLVERYNVSGPLSLEIATAVDRDLSDSPWRGLFHAALTTDRRFQRGLFDESCITGTSSTQPDEPSMLTRLKDGALQTQPFTVAGICRLSQRRLTGTEADTFDYGLALLKTSAALVYTVHLAATHRMAMATDSQAHFTLLSRMATRDRIELENHWRERVGY